jgi:hypothetical protein
MKKVKVEYEVYDFKELSREAKDKAIEIWYEAENYPFLEEELTESCKALLKENKIKYFDDLKLGYSLSYSQGDGLHFVGNFEWKQYNIRIIHNYRYAFSSSAEISLINTEGEEITEGKDYEEFNSIYLNICKKLEKEGYATLEYRMNDKEFQEHCKVNKYNFFKDGRMANL